MSMRRCRLGVWAGLLALGVLAGGPAAAQTVSSVEQAVAGQTTIIERFTPPPRVGSIDITVEDARRRVPEAAAGKVRLTLRSLTVEGADSVPYETLAPIWRDRIGTEVSVADLYRMAEAVDAAYLRAGYFSMTIVPVQDFRSGRITLRVYESWVARVEIKSSVPGIERRLAPYLDRIMAMRPIRVKEAERILLLMSDLGGMEIEGTFVRPDTPTGGGLLELEVGFDRRAGAVGLDNLGTDAVGPLELSANVAFSDLFGLFETTSLVAVTVPDSPSEMRLLQFTQDLPIGHDGLMLGYGFTHIGQRPGGDLKAQHIEIETNIASARLSYPFVRTLDTSLTGELEVNARTDDVHLAGASVQDIRVNWLLGSLRAQREVGGGSLSGSVGLGQGLGHDLVRADVPDDFRLGRIDLDFSRPLDERTSLRLRAAGQYAATPLPAAVQFALGGDPYGQAFDGGSLVGDSGAAAAVELDRAVDTGLPLLGTVSLLAIADWGVVWNHDTGADYARGTLGSAGVGFSGLLRDRVSYQVLAVVPWDATNAVDDPGTRVFFRLGWLL